MVVMEAMHPGGSGLAFLTSDGVTVAQTPRSSTPSTTAGPKACQPSVAHWALTEYGRSLRTSAHFPCPPPSRRSHGKSRDPTEPSAMQENQRDIGLIRALGPWTLAASIVSMIVGAGIFAVPAALAACVGPYAPLAFLACGVAVGAVAICLAEGGSRVPTSGGIYGVVEAAFGPLAGYVSGTLLWVCCVLACGAVAAALADVAATLFPQSLIGPVRGAVIVGV